MVADDLAAWMVRAFGGRGGVVSAWPIPSPGWLRVIGTLDRERDRLALTLLAAAAAIAVNAGPS